ncbi:MAG: helix-turn-helix domain-containing protein [Firmicutes bacterium]|nr:helix-turn-helix domain-containing protein [Bacillota bacterium]
MSDYSQRFALNLRVLRQKKGLTQKAFGELLGYSEKTVSKWE